MNPYIRLMAFDFRLYMRDRLTLFWVLIYPVLMLLIFGSIYGNQADPVTGMRFIESYVPSLCAMNVISVSVFTLNINMLNQREHDILRRFRVTPVPKTAVLASHAAQGLFLVTAGALEILIVSKLVWDIHIGIGTLLLMFACLYFGCLSFFNLGFAMSGIARTPGAASGIAMAVFFPMLFLSGISMPIDMLPRFMQVISDWLPMTYFVRLVQGVGQGGGLMEYGTELAVIAGFGILAFVCALLLFRWEK